MGFACIQVARSNHKGHQEGFHGSSSSFVIPICNIDSIQILTVSLLNEKKLNIGNASQCSQEAGLWVHHSGRACCLLSLLSSSLPPSETGVPLILLHYVLLMTFSGLMVLLQGQIELNDESHYFTRAEFDKRQVCDHTVVRVQCKITEGKRRSVFHDRRITRRNENHFGFVLCSCACSFFLVTQHLGLLMVFVV